VVYSLAGGIVRFRVRLGLKNGRGFSAVGISIAGGVSHNIGQVAVAVWVTGNKAVFYYLPVLVVAGVLTGMLMGMLALRVMRAIPGGNQV
ncbi:MAG: Gx transporter family protein, partial [Lachnospiraceae bacterium]|nr:Gx transporter family protein [Lachnospiraceae bacterium]